MGKLLNKQRGYHKNTTFAVYVGIISFFETINLLKLSTTFSVINLVGSFKFLTIKIECLCP